MLGWDAFVVSVGFIFPLPKVKIKLDFWERELVLFIGILSWGS